jgi:transposase InsO family protein
MYLILKKFMAFVEKNGYSIKSLKTNRRGRFCSIKFNDFYKDHGIKRLLVVFRSPYQNGMVKRNNISIHNMTRNMLKTKKMPKEFRAEIVDCVVYLSTRCPTKGLNDVTLQEAWNERKLNATYLKVFGSIDYVHVHEQVKTKLDDKNKMMIFMGYDQKSKEYKLYNPNEGKKVISSDVEFDKERA